MPQPPPPSGPEVGKRDREDFDKIVTLYVAARSGQVLRGPDIVVAAELLNEAKGGSARGEIGMHKYAIQMTVADSRERVDDTERGEQQRLAQRAFEQLRPEQQQVLQLAIHHGCSHEQIATATGMPLGTVKTHARRGLIKIRQILEQQGVLSPEDRARLEDSAEGTR